MTDGAWLKGLKVGDRVYEDSRNGYTLLTIKAVTKSQIVCEYKFADGRTSEWRYRAKDGRQVSKDPWNNRFITPATDDIRNEIKRHNIEYRANRIADIKVTVENMDRIKELVDELNRIGKPQKTEDL